MADQHPVKEFPITRWSLVLHTQKDSGEDAARRALDELCVLYWHPIYAFARQCGQSPEDAEDLTQGFFARLIEQRLFAKADPSLGRLRSFLIGAFKHFMSEEWRRAHRQKRGGGQVLAAIDAAEAEERFLEAASTGLSPDLIFEQRWFETLLRGALDDLEKEYRRRGKGNLFERLHSFLAWNSGDEQLEAIARELGMSSGALRVTIYRMRQRFREVLIRKVADTTKSPADAEEELNHLRRIMNA